MRGGMCRHYNGYQKGTCKLGVEYRPLVGGPNIGWAARLPCIPESSLRKEPMAKCDKYEEPTPAEIMAEKIELQAHSEKMQEAIGRIRETKVNQGMVECPKCQSNLRFSVAKINGHIWAKCDTTGCLAWMM